MRRTRPELLAAIRQRIAKRATQPRKPRPLRRPDKPMPTPSPAFWRDLDLMHARNEARP